MSSTSVWRALLLVLGLLMAKQASAGTPIDASLQDLWRSHAFVCQGNDLWPSFPARKPADGDACDDGDETLFDALMCAAGMPEGCASVKASQAPDGRWYRSPRRAAMAQKVCGDSSASQADKEKWCRNSFSPDMALGVELWALTTSNPDAIRSWVQWIDRSRPCVIGNGDNCIRGLARFCTDDTEKGCTVRPGDYATLSVTLEALGLAKFGGNTKCPDGTSATFSLSDVMLFAMCEVHPSERDILLGDSILNKPGFSQHLVGVAVMLVRAAKLDDVRVKAAAAILSLKQPKNPFFAYLAEAPLGRVRDMTVGLCPATESQIPPPPTDWAWQREDSEKAWNRSLLWDCLFMASLLR